jgi:serine protease Do
MFRGRSRSRVSVVRTAVYGGIALTLAVGLVWGAGAAEEPEGRSDPLADRASAALPAPVVVAAGGATLPSLADIVQRVSPAVVSLTVQMSVGEGSRRRTGTAFGSGFVIEPAGYIVTNSHVVANSTEIEASFSDGSKYKARLVGRDDATDIALIKIDGAKPLPSVKFGDDRLSRVGDWVLAVGNPFNFGGTVTAGIISARGRDQVGSGQFTDYLQLDAAINQGNSGGPTFDMSGRVIGMNTLGYIAPTGERASGIGFAIPAATIRRVVSDLKATGTVTRGFLGVQIESLSEETARALGLPNTNGAIVTEVIAGSPAEKAGIKRGDVIIKMNGQTVKDNRELSRRIAALQVGQTATFTIWRDNRQITISVTVGKRDAVATLEVPMLIGEAKFTSLGLGLETITPEVRATFALTQKTEGVLILDIDRKSDAAAQGLRPGDTIVGVGSTDVKSLTDVNLAIEKAKALKRDAVVLFVVTQQGLKTHVPVKLAN